MSSLRIDGGSRRGIALPLASGDRKGTPLPAQFIIEPIHIWVRITHHIISMASSIAKANDTLNVQSLWDRLPRPIIGLAPMDGVSDQPFRHIQKKYGNPMVVFTEFTSVEGVCLGNARTLRDFLYDESQRPIIAQIYGYVPDYFRQTAILLCQLGFDGVDINMGCPAKNIANAGAGAGLIRTPELARQIIEATKTGVREWANGATVDDCEDLTEEIKTEVRFRRQLLPGHARRRRRIPVSVKTRIGYSKPVIETWIPTLLEMQPAAITIHGRTLEQKYSGKANWDTIGRAVELASDSATLILGNGDIDSTGTARQHVTTYGVDGVLIARASMGNPLIFSTKHKRFKDNGEPESWPDSANLCTIALEHAELYERTFSHYPTYHFLPMRKHLGWYAMGIPGAKKFRGKLVNTHSAQDAAQILLDCLAQS